MFAIIHTEMERKFCSIFYPLYLMEAFLDAPQNIFPKKEQLYMCILVRHVLQPQRNDELFPLLLQMVCISGRLGERDEANLNVTSTTRMLFRDILGNTGPENEGMQNLAKQDPARGRQNR